MKRFKTFFVMSMVLLLGGCAARGELSAETSANGTEVPKQTKIREEAASEEVILPRKYSYVQEGRMPLLRNQEGTNTCWAFASLSALESSKDEDGQGSYSADHLLFHNPFGRRFEEGGSYIVTMAYLLAWNGPVPEEADPFDGESPQGLEPCVHVQEVRQAEPGDYEAIKRFIYLYGGVESALYLDFENSMTESSYYNKEFNAFCYQGDQVSNHDVVIVGWDDDYPAENFVGEVSSDGAFLCQNSWGERFGDQGTFYVSYEDVNIGSYGIVYSRIDPTDHYDRIYQSDLCGFTAQIGYQKEECWFANVYPAEEDLLLRAVGFYATGKNTAYQIYAVSDFQDEDSFRERQFICRGFLEDAGFYTIDFPEAVQINAGKEFAVIVDVTTENADYPVAIECQVDGLSENADISDGKGYLSYQGNLWEHIEETKNYNVCLKAYADLKPSALR